MKLPIALQLYSVRDDMVTDFAVTFKKIMELGYDGAGFVGLLGKTAAEVKNLCQGIGLTPIPAQIPFIDMINDINILDAHVESGLKFVVILYLTDECRHENEELLEDSDEIEKLGKKANGSSIKIAYRNHNFELLKFDGEYAYDVYYWHICVCMDSENTDLK